jgi:outer membrane protein
MAAGAVSSAAAQDLTFDAGTTEGAGAVTAAEPPRAWKYTLGLGVAAVPEYEGAEDYEGAPVPIGRMQNGYRYGQVFGTKFSSNVADDPNLRFGPVANVRANRDDVENDRVDALSDVDTALEVGAQAGYEGSIPDGTLGVEVEWLYDIVDSHGGWLLKPQIMYTSQVAPNLNFGTSGFFNYASKDYVDTYFSVGPADSAASGLPTFDGDSGVKDFGVEAGFSYGLGRSWRAGGFGTWKRLVGDAADSPITDEGSKNQFTAGLYLTYSWPK